MTYLRDLERELRALLKEGDETKIVRFAKEKALESYRNRSDAAILSAVSGEGQFRTGYLAHLVSGGGYYSALALINLAKQPQRVSITADGLEVNGGARTPQSGRTREFSRD